MHTKSCFPSAHHEPSAVRVRAQNRMHVGKSNKKAPCHIPTLQTAWEAAQLDQDNLGPLAPSVIVPSPPVLFTAVVVSSDMPKLTAPSEEHPPPSLIQSLVELVAFDIYVVVSLYGMRHHYASTHLTTALSFLSSITPYPVVSSLHLSTGTCHLVGCQRTIMCHPARSRSGVVGHPSFGTTLGRSVGLHVVGEPRVQIFIRWVVGVDLSSNDAR